MQCHFSLRTALLVFIVGLLIVSASSFLRHKSIDESEPINLDQLRASIDKDVNLRMQGIHLVEERAGRRLWELEARFAENRTGEPLIHLRELTIRFFRVHKKSPDTAPAMVDSAADEQAILTAQAGTFDRQSRDLKVWGDVRVNKQKGASVFRTTTMTWHSEKEVIETDQPVEITSPRYKIVARGLSSTAGFERIILKEKVQASLYFNRQRNADKAKPARTSGRING